MLCFPSADSARADGLLAMGGDLSTTTLLTAYTQGIFPWFNEDQPILWWSPDPRLVLFPDHVRISRSLRKSLKNKGYQVKFDNDFSSVIHACAELRADQEGTWIHPEMITAYTALHHAGHAHSVEVYQDTRLVGGLYGLAIGRVFFGESMFHRASDASKVALVILSHHLHAWGYALIDCQVQTAHLMTLGAKEIPRTRFIDLLGAHCHQMTDRQGPWCIEVDPALF